MMRVLAFDLFGTVFDMSAVPREEIRAYIEHIRKTEWEPLRLPSQWEWLPTYPDSKEGIKDLQQNFFVVTCSNAPLGMTAKMSKNRGIDWDCIIPLELNKVYKPNPKAYLTVCEVLNVEPNQVTMVTANKGFGDLEGAFSVGMKSALIRDDLIPSIIDLNRALRQ